MERITVSSEDIQVQKRELPQLPRKEPSPLKGLLKDSSHEELVKVADFIKSLRSPEPPLQDSGPRVLEITDVPIHEESGTSDWNSEFQKYMAKKKQRSFEKVFRESTKTKDKDMERHIFLSDLQIPDHNKQVLKAVRKFLKDFSPDTLHLLGDMLNLTNAGKYDVTGNYTHTLGDEIREGRVVIEDLIRIARQANPTTRIIWYEGNHEYRLQKFLAANANALTDVTDAEGEQVVSIPHLFNLKKLGVEWVPYFDTHREGNDIEVEHGDVARSKSGNTAHAMLDRRGRSGFSGHTHKMALVTRNQGGDVKFWIENGSLCNLETTPRWNKKPDWVNGFSVAIFDKKSGVTHPMPILVQNNQFMFGSKVYKP